MNVTSNPPGKAIAAPRHPRSSIVFGEEMLLGPKVKLVISIDDNEELARLVGLHFKHAESNAKHLLDDIAADLDARTQKFPNSPTVWVQAGLSHLAAANYEKAEAAFKVALDVDPHSRSAKLGLARVANELGQLTSSIAILNELRLEHPEDLDIRVALAVVIANMSGPEAALKELDFEPKIPSRPASFFATRGTLKVATGDQRGAIRDLRKVVKLKPEWVQARNVLGIAEMKAGHVSSAEKRFRETVRVGPMYLEGFLNLLRVLMHEERYREVLDLASARFPEILEAPSAVGRVASQASLELEEWSEARLWLESALGKTDDKWARARLLNDLGVAYSRIGKHSDAEKKFALAVEAYPLEVAIVNRAKALLSVRSPIAAVGWLHAAPLSGENTSPSIERRKVLASALNSARMFKDAASAYEDLVKDRLADRFAFATLAAIYTDNLGDVERGVDAARLGLEENLGDALLTNNLAYSLLMAGRVKEARSVLEAELSPGLIEAVALKATRGLLLLKEGDINGGRKLYDQALAIAENESVRERVRAKRNLEVARALLRMNADHPEILSLLKEASSARESAYPYQLHAKAELLRLK